MRIGACVLGLGLTVAWATLALRIDTRADTLHNLSAVLEGRPFVYGGDVMPMLPFYNRILFPLIHRTLVEHVPLLRVGQWYILLRVLSILLALACFAWVCRRSLRASPRDTCLATAFLAVSMMTTFSFPWEEPTDAFDVCAMSLAVMVALESRLLLCIAVAVLFSTNRESAAYAGIIWFLMAPSSRPFLRRAIEGGIICLLAYGVTIGLRVSISKTGTMNLVMIEQNIRVFLHALSPFVITNWLALLIGIASMLILNIEIKKPVARKLAIAAAIFVVPAMIFGLLNELRIFLPSFVMLCFATAAEDRRAID